MKVRKEKMSVLIRLSIVFAFITSARCDAGFFDNFFGLKEPNSVTSNGGSIKGDSKIVGGEKSPIHYPYQISLQMQTRGGGGGFFFFQQPPSNWSHFCGGSILNENFIVTAAHCISGFNTSRMSVLAGTSDLRQESRGSRHLIDNCIIHPEYVELNNSDVAVCRLQSPFAMGENIAPITLSKEYVGGGQNCTLTGWGYTSMIRGFPLPNELQRATLPTLTNEECNERGHNVGPKEICTLSRFGQGACGG